MALFQVLNLSMKCNCCRGAICVLCQISSLGTSLVPLLSQGRSLKSCRSEWPFNSQGPHCYSHRTRINHLCQVDSLDYLLLGPVQWGEHLLGSQSLPSCGASVEKLPSTFSYLVHFFSFRGIQCAIK